MKDAMEGIDYMTNSEVVKYAYEHGYGEFIATNHDGELVNRNELINSIIEGDLRLMWDGTELDPAGGYGLYSHV